MTSQGQGQIMYFLVNESPSKVLDGTASNFVDLHRSHDVEGTGLHFM